MKVVLEIIYKISKYQKVNLLINKNVKSIKRLIKSNKIKNINFHKIKTDRIWLRDSGPIFLTSKKKRKSVILNFNFNGWAKYKNYKNDNKINNKISEITNLDKINPTVKKNKKIRKVIMEGGAFDVNGSGSIILTEEDSTISFSKPAKDSKSFGIRNLPELSTSTTFNPAI